jgi:hypothetical protein
MDQKHALSDGAPLCGILIELGLPQNARERS